VELVRASGASGSLAGIIRAEVRGVPVPSSPSSEVPLRPELSRQPVSRLHPGSRRVVLLDELATVVLRLRVESNPEASPSRFFRLLCSRLAIRTLLVQFQTLQRSHIFIIDPLWLAALLVVAAVPEHLCVPARWREVQDPILLLFLGGGSRNFLIRNLHARREPPFLGHLVLLLLLLLRTGTTTGASSGVDSQGAVVHVLSAGRLLPSSALRVSTAVLERASGTAEPSRTAHRSE